MKTNHVSFSALLIAIVMMVISCQKEDALSVDKPNSNSDFELAVEELAQKLPESDRSAFIQSQSPEGIQKKIATSYVSQLCDGVITAGNLPLNGREFYSFLAQAGDTVSISVVRTDCGLDPAFFLYQGVGADTDDLSFLGFADDNEAIPAACVSTCFAFYDPSLSLIAPATDYYTLDIWEFISGSCYVDGAYEVTVTGVICNVIIDGCDSGVLDRILSNGMTITQSIADCAASAKNHGAFVSCVAKLTNQLKKDGEITGAEKGAIQSCAAGSSLPL